MTITFRCVSGPPKFVDRPSDTKVIAGTLKVELHCDTSSVPAAEFVWTKEGKIVSDGSVSRFSLKASTPGEGILVITNVMYDDWGEYKCTATNEHGFVAAAATLEVQGILNGTLLCDYSKYSNELII